MRKRQMSTHPPIDHPNAVPPNSNGETLSIWSQFTGVHPPNRIQTIAYVDHRPYRPADVHQCVLTRLYGFIYGHIGWWHSYLCCQILTTFNMSVWQVYGIQCVWPAVGCHLPGSASLPNEKVHIWGHLYRNRVHVIRRLNFNFVSIEPKHFWSRVPKWHLSIAHGIVS